MNVTDQMADVIVSAVIVVAFYQHRTVLDIAYSERTLTESGISSETYQQLAIIVAIQLAFEIVTNLLGQFIALKTKINTVSLWKTRHRFTFLVYFPQFIIVSL